MKHILFTLYLIVLSSALVGQSTVILKGKKSITGTILSYDIGHAISMQLENGTRVIIRNSEIKSVMIDGKPIFDEKPTKTYTFEEGSIKFAWENMLLTNASHGGAGLTLSGLYQWKHYASVGVGLGYHNYNAEEGRGHIPLFIQARSYVKAQRVSPFVDIKGGYGFSTGKSNEQFIDAKGGAFFQGMIGVRWGTNPFTITSGLGLQTQEAYYYYNHRWNGGTVEERRQYRRLVLSLGFLF